MLLATEDNVTLEVDKLHHQNGSGMDMSLLVQIERDSLNAIYSSINLPDGTRLHLDFEGRIYVLPLSKRETRKS